MGNSVNKVILIGRLGKDPDIKFTGSGKAVANFSIATDESYKNKDGEKVKKTEWINIVVWGNSVESFIQPYIHKGDLVYIEGKLQTRSWEDKQGTTKYTTEVNVTDIKGLVTTPSDSQPTQTRTANKPATRAAAPTQEVGDEDIPYF